MYHTWILYDPMGYICFPFFRPKSRDMPQIFIWWICAVGFCKRRWKATWENNKLAMKCQYVGLICRGETLDPWKSLMFAMKSTRLQFFGWDQTIQNCISSFEEFLSIIVRCLGWQYNDAPVMQNCNLSRPASWGHGGAITAIKGNFGFPSWAVEPCKWRRSNELQVWGGKVYLSLALWKFVVFFFGGGEVVWKWMIIWGCNLTIIYVHFSYRVTLQLLLLQTKPSKVFTIFQAIFLRGELTVLSGVDKGNGDSLWNNCVWMAWTFWFRAVLQLFLQTFRHFATRFHVVESQ